MTAIAQKQNPRRQCAKCPWRATTDPHDIPDGYCEVAHGKLEGTIANPGSLEGARGVLRIFACHETSHGQELPCVGWLEQQLGPGNNIGLRLAANRGQIDANVVTVGEQHEWFEDTLPAEGE